MNRFQDEEIDWYLEKLKVVFVKKMVFFYFETGKKILKLGNK